MNRLVVVVLLLVVGVVALGVYLDWFHFSSSGAQDPGKVDVGVSIDKDKIKSDAEKAKEKVKGVGGQGKDKTEDARPQETVPPK